MKLSKLTPALILAALAFSIAPVRAQNTKACIIPTSDTIAGIAKINQVIKARNLARQAAEMTNGGLRQYRAENSMHGPIAEAPCVDNGNGTYTFKFQGMMPGTIGPVYDTVVTVDSQSWNVIVDSNTVNR